MNDSSMCLVFQVPQSVVKRCKVEGGSVDERIHRRLSFRFLKSLVEGIKVEGGRWEEKVGKLVHPGMTIWSQKWICLRKLTLFIVLA